jgi:hypothetical protein
VSLRAEASGEPDGSGWSPSPYYLVVELLAGALDPAFACRFLLVAYPYAGGTMVREGFVTAGSGAARVPR